MLEPRGTLELDPAELNFLKGEDSELAGVVGRNEGLGADRFEIADEELAADDTAPPADDPDVVAVGATTDRSSDT